MKAMKSDNFGASTGGFNVLNVNKASEEDAGDFFFELRNRPFLDAAINKGDDVALATIPKGRDALIDEKGKLIGMYAKEIDYLVKIDYKPVNITVAKWKEIKGWFK